MQLHGYMRTQIKQVNLINFRVFWTFFVSFPVCDVTGKCEDYCNVDGQLIKPGESFKTKDCSEIICSKDFTARGVTCGIAIEDGCKMEPDFTLEYPDCCYKICGEKVE